MGNMFALFNNNPPTPAHREGNNRDFEFDFELDLDENQFESFELPEIFLGRYMHDFKVNHTGIIDRIGKRCFLMGLDRSLIPAPKVDYYDHHNHCTPTSECVQHLHHNIVIIIFIITTMMLT